MRRAASILGLSSVVFAFAALCGCSGNHSDSQLLDRLFPASTSTLANEVALDRAIHLSALTQNDRPFHLVLDITPPAQASPELRSPADMHAQIEIFWMNPITYRTVIRSPSFSQTRIVNGNVVEEHNTGDFYPRWIQNFVDALLEPAPKAATLRRVAGSIPVGPTAHACITHPAANDSNLLSETVLAASPENTTSAETNEIASAQVCFQGDQPLLSSGVEFGRYVSYDDFAPFGKQLVPRTLVNDLPVNILLRGRMTTLEPLPTAEESLVKAHEFTLPANQIQTALVSRQTAEALLASPLPAPHSSASASVAPRTIYIRTDRSGKVREAYRNSVDHYHLQDAALSHALTLKFKPLVINGIPQQMEAPIAIP